MDKEEAIKYLIKHSIYGDEWSGAGMWEAVLKVMKHKGKISEKRLKELLEYADSF